MKRLRAFAVALIFVTCGIGMSACSLFGSNLRDQEELTIGEVGHVRVWETFQLMTSGGSGTGEVTFELVSGTAVVTSEGFVSGLTEVGEVVVNATKAKDSKFKAITSEEFSFTVNKGLQTVFSITAVTGKRMEDTFQLATTGGRGTGEVTFELVDDELGSTATVSSTGEVEVFKAGEITVKATKDGDVNFESGTALRTMAFGKKLQEALVIDAVGTITFGDADFQLTTDGGSGTGSITFELVSGTAGTVSETGWVEILGAGSISVKAIKAGDETFDTMESTPLVITIGKASPATPLATPDAITYDPNKTLADIELPAGWTWADDEIVPTPAASEYLANFAGDDNYQPVTNVAVSLTVSKAEQETLAVMDPGTKTYGGDPFQLNTTGGCGTGIVTYELVSGTAASVDEGGLVVIAGVGDITVKATKAGDACYNQAESAGFTITILAQPLSEPSTSITIQPMGDTGISFEEPKISWTAVDNATSYSIKILEEGTTIVDKNIGNVFEYEFTDAELSHNTGYTVSVMAHGNGTTYGVSDWSAEESYTHRHRLATPENVQIVVSYETAPTKSDVTLSWDAVTNAKGYYIYINGVNKQSIVGMIYDFSVGTGPIQMYIEPGDELEIVVCHHVSPGYRNSLKSTAIICPAA